MKRLALKVRLARFLKANPGWIAKGALCDLARDKVGATGEHTGRRLRELENENVVQVKYEKGHAYYRHKETEATAAKVARGLDWFESLPTSI